MLLSTYLLFPRAALANYKNINVYIAQIANQELGKTQFSSSFLFFFSSSVNRKQSSKK